MIDPTKQPVRVTYQGKEYVVKFKHEQRFETFLGKFTPRQIRGTTTAYIGDFNEPLVLAKAYCAISDQFVKRKGRIISAHRLIKKLESK